MLKSIFVKIKKLGSIVPTWLVFLFITAIFAMEDSLIGAGIFGFNAILSVISRLIKKS
ncbi:hypothetical protein JCM15060_11090 [Halanaerobaculum tunisiense]